MEKINLNHELLFIKDFDNGKTQNVEIKIGRKTFLMDIDKNTASACIDFYEKKDKDRNKFSKYSINGTLGVFVFPDAMLTKDFFENIEKIKFAQDIYEKYNNILKR